MPLSLIYCDEISFSSQAESFLDIENWKTLDFTHMTGSETEVLVAFIEDTYANIEVFSRAKKQLIIVTK